VTDRALVRKTDLAWLLGRAVAREEARLSEVPEVQDRLLALPVQDIIERAWILQPPDALFQAEMQAKFDLERLKSGPGVYLPDSSKRALAAIQESPSAAEVGDLGFIDAFFAPYYPSFQGDSASTYQWMICSRRIRWAPWQATGNPFTARIVFGSGPLDQRAIAPPEPGDPFFCTPRPDIYRNPATPELGRYFGLDLSRPWRELRPVMLNIENLMKLVGDPVGHANQPSYPWPGPARITGYWWELAQSGLRELVRQPGILTEDVARLWITLSLLTHYNALVAQARDQMEKSAQSERFNLTVLTVALVAFGLVLGIAIGPLIAGGFKVASGVLTDVEKRDAAKDLNAAAKELQTTDPAFAGQVQWSAQYIQRMLTEASRPAGTPPPSQGGGALEAVVGIGVPTLLSIGLSLLRR
jgi:hypothetical protein